ncbi:MAG: carbohydrate binding family 9 domain-containing protein [Bacteroidetes bacterium]|nr:carbohydrate binding family 9 domain-containing protein [Bacteroidota bacterium]MBU1113527.1 carbohydrate binding family 9 domain-containing protein [Bacteroidota bacterium]MBU1797475.1 carbohydrate binding family 9 domain-containing protein [Bacteroidota bacterium]
MKKYFTLVLLLTYTSMIFGTKTEDTNKSVHSYKLDAPLVLDGKLSESVYQNTPISNFIQKDPEEGKPTSEKTEVWISHDDANLYFSGRFYDSEPDSMDVTLMRRDNMVNSDWFWIYMDPYNDNRTGNYFAVNPGGSMCDGTLYNDDWMSDSWDGIWDVKTDINEHGWTTEIKIPFSQLRFNESKEMVWGINLNRDIKRKHEMSFLVMVPKTESGFVSRFADLTGLDGIIPKKRLEVLPYLVQKAQYLSNKENDPFYAGNQYQTSFGADVKFGIGSNLNVDVTINPDFGQVEVDPAVVNLSAFESYFNEKRPFFIEGENIFEFGSGGANNNWGFNFGTPTLFYSRRIGRSPQGYATTKGFVDQPNETRILGAGKLSGKIDDTWSIGILSAVTEKSNARIYTEAKDIVKEEVEPLTHYGVFRTRKEFNGGNQAIGAIFTSVNRDLSNQNLKLLLSDQAYSYGLDGWTFLDENKTYVLTGIVAGSYVHGSKEALLNIQRQPYRYFQRPDKTYMTLDTKRTSLSGMFSRFMINKQEGNFYLNSAIGTATPGFEFNDIGYQWYADRINGHIVTGYRWYEPDKLSRQKSIYLAFCRNSDYEDNVSRMGFYSNGRVQFLNYWTARMEASYNFESTSTTLTRGGPKVVIADNYSFNISAETDSREKIILSPDVGYWRNGFGSYDFSAGFDVVWKPESQLNISVGPEYYFTNSKYQWVRAIADEKATATYGSRYIFGEMDQYTISADIRVDWSFTSTFSLQLYLQPLISVGNYNNFRELAKPNSSEFNSYGENGSTIEYDTESEKYTVTPDENAPDKSFSFYNPNFNFKSLRGNAVLRWEVLPGSVLYFVWTHEKMNFQDPGEFHLGKDFSNLWESEADNIFLVKFSYWIDI